MEKYKVLIVFVCLSLIFSQVGTGAEPEKVILSLESTLNLALEHNPQLKVAEKEVEKANAAVWEAYSVVLPQLDASLNFQHAWEIQESTIPNFLKPMLAPLAPYIQGLDQMPDFVNLSFGLKNTLTYGASVTQPLFLGGAGIAGIKIANAGVRSSEHNLDAQRQTLIFDCVNGFYSALLATKLVDVQQEALAQAQANLDAVTKKYDVGAASGFDKMRAEVEVANLKPSLISAKNNYEIALTQLRTIIGLDRATVIEILGDFVYADDEFGNLTLREMQDMASENRPEMLILHEQKQITQQGINMARSNFLPKILFMTDYSYLAMRDDMKFNQKDFSKGFTSAVSLQIPLFHGFRSVKQYQKAKLDYHIMQDMEKQVSDGVYAETEVAYNKFQESRQKYLSAKETVALAQEALRMANLMYDEGANTQLDVLNSRLSLTQAQMNYYRSLYDHQVARYKLRKVTGQTRGIL